MLITNTIKPNDIVVLKLVTSEEVIAKVLEITGDSIKISKPLTLSFANNPLTSEGGLIPLPWSVSIEEETILEIKKDKIIFLSKARKEIVGMYMKITSNIVIPTEGGLKNVIDKQ